MRLGGHPVRTATFERKTDAKRWAQQVGSAIRKGRHFGTREAKRQTLGDLVDFYNTERPNSALNGQTPAEVYGAGRPVDMLDKAIALPTSPQAQQQQQDVINRILAA